MAAPQEGDVVGVAFADAGLEYLELLVQFPEALFVLFGQGFLQTEFKAIVHEHLGLFIKAGGKAEKFAAAKEVGDALTAWVPDGVFEGRKVVSASISEEDLFTHEAGNDHWVVGGHEDSGVVFL